MCFRDDYHVVYKLNKNWYYNEKVYRLIIFIHNQIDLAEAVNLSQWI